MTIRQDRISETIALRFISLMADGIMLPESDLEITNRHEDYKDIFDRPANKWIAAEVYAYLRGYKKACKIIRAKRNTGETK